MLSVNVIRDECLDWLIVWMDTLIVSKSKSPTRNKLGMSFIQLVRQELEASDEYSVDRHKELVRKELFDRHYSESVINEWVDYIE